MHDRGPAGQPVTPLLRGGSVRTRLLWLVFGAVLPTLVATVWLAVLERREAVRGTEAQLLGVLHQAQARHEDLLLLGRRLLQAAVLSPAIAIGDRTACEAALTTLAAASPEIINPTRTAIEGVVDCAPGRPVGADVRTSPAFRRTLESDSVVIGRYVRSRSIPEAVVPMNRRIRTADGRVAGVLSIGLRMGWFNPSLAREGLPDGAVVSLVDATGTVLASAPDAGAVGKPYVGAALGALVAAAHGRAITDGAAADGKPRRIAVAQLRSPADQAVLLTVSVPEASILDDANVALALRLTLVLVALLVSWLLVVALLRPLVLHDLERLDDAADRIGTGDFSARTGVLRAPKELQRLADTMDDMAARLAAREERQLQAQKLESLGRLAGGVAHDFNNMLTAVMGNVDEVRDGLPVGSEARQQLETALAAARRSGQLTSQLLAFARRDGLTVNTLVLRDVLLETAELMRRTLGPEIAVEVECEPTVRIGADRARLEQALVNLAFNARDAMPAGGRLSMRARRVSGQEVPKEGAADEWVRLDVQDTGAGMPPDVRQRVFEPFFTTKPTGQGTGLGLSMVYASMEQFGGTTSLVSAVGEGTVVSLWFPIRTDARREAEVARLQDTAGVAAAPSACVLVVEDEPAVRDVAVRALRRAGYDVLEAEDGVVALERLQDLSSRIELVVSDVRMPRMGGAELAQAIRSRWPALPLLLISGFHGESRLDPILEMPATRLLAKPFRTPDLTAVVAEMLAEANGRA